MTKISAALYACLALSSAAATPNENVPPGVLHFPLTRKPLAERVRYLVKRDDTVDIQLADKTSMFSTPLEIGSNNQTVQVLVDTGSSDLWVMSRSNPYCDSITSNDEQADSTSDRSDGKITCKSDSMFNTSASSTFSANSTSFSVTYGDYTFANGTYGQDDISYGGITIKKANFAVANQSNSSTAVWGIGLAGLESTVTTRNLDGTLSPTYSNLPMQMKEQGIISQNAYSLWLNDVNASDGELLFGGVDHTKYSGQLQTVPMISSYSGSKPNTLQVMLNGISIYQGTQSAEVVSCAVPVLLDSGTTFMMLPAPFLDAILTSVGGVYTNRGYVVSCGMSGGLSFNFSGASINVPFSEITFALTRDVCMLGVMESSGTIILGDTFLRSAYVVFDLDNYEVSLANVNYNVTSSSVEVISSAVPSATQASGYSNTEAAVTFSTNIASFFQTTASVADGSITTSSFPTGTVSSNRASSLLGSPTGSSSSSTASSSDSQRKNGASSVNYSSSVLSASLTVLLGLIGITVFA